MMPYYTCIALTEHMKLWMMRFINVVNNNHSCLVQTLNWLCTQNPIMASYDLLRLTLALADIR